jgi:dUTP pyrophosphatase
MFRRSMDQIPLHQLDPDARLPARATPGSFGYDLATAQDETVAPGETRVLATGFALARDLPLDRGGGLAMLILPRSSLSLTFGLILPNAPGLVDADYAGPIGVLVHNLRAEPVTVPAGTRIAQAVFVEVRFPALRPTTEADPARTRGGFGSTGV